MEVPREYAGIKPLYCEIEARDYSIPVELLFEIHAAFDHLRRFYVNGDDEITSSRRAIGHFNKDSQQREYRPRSYKSEKMA